MNGKTSFALIFLAVVAIIALIGLILLGSKNLSSPSGNFVEDEWYSGNENNDENSNSMTGNAEKHWRTPEKPNWPWFPF